MRDLPAPTLVTKPEQLNDLAARLAKEPIIAVDTESNSLFAYRERVCLIQFSIPGEDFLVDPLVLDDLSVLGPVFADEYIEKIFHAAEYDLLTMKRDYDFVFNNIFDTMVAARILGREKVGLGSMLEAEFGVKVEKKYQKADWGKRPLTKGMLGYARLDTYYLIKLAEKIKIGLEKIARWPFAHEDFARLSQVNGSPPGEPNTDVWRISGARDLTPQQVAVLKRLSDYRQERAEKLDVPLFKVIGDRSLAAVAAAAPNHINDLYEIEKLSSGHIKRHGQAMLQAVKEGLQDQPLKRPRKKRLPEDVHNRLEVLKQWRRETSKGLGVESDVVLPKDVMFDLAHENPNRSDDLLEVMESVPYRRQRYGAAILAVLNND